MGDGEIVETVDIRQPVRVEMEYEVLKSGRVLMPYHHVHNEEGVLLFSAHDVDARWAGRARQEGEWVSTAEIPGDLLAEGTHFVSSGLITLDPVVTQFYERDVVSFRVIESPGPDGARGGWVGPMGGVVRPLLKWDTRFTPSGGQTADPNRLTRGSS
jgi:lipopolysaccharide transport system ATP-binding protein